MFRSLTMIILAAALTATSAHAQDSATQAQYRGPPENDGVVRFGERGQIAISTDAALSFGRTTQDGARAATVLSVLPAADVFVIRRLSVGGFVGVRYQKQGSEKATSFQFGPRVGYNVDIAQRISVWPRVGFSFSHTKSTSEVVVDGDQLSRKTTNNALGLNLYAPLMFHPAPHFFAGLGPYLDTDLNGDNRATTWGFRLTVGGWVKP